MNIETVWQQYRSNIKSYLHSRISNSADVDDLLQMILIKTHKNLATLKSEDSVKSWLFQVSKRTIIDYYRGARRLPETEIEKLWYGKDDKSVQQEFAECVTPFVNALPTDSADILNAIDIQGQSQKEFANKSGVSYSTLKSRVQKSRRQLRGLLLNCCKLSLDQFGNVVEFEPKSGNCKKC